MPSYLLDTDKKVFDDMFSGKSYKFWKSNTNEKGKTLHISLTKKWPCAEWNDFLLSKS